MREICQNHPDRPVAVKLHDITTGVHVVTPLCFDCACDAGDPTALMLKAQSLAMDTIMESLSPTRLESEMVQ